VLDCISNGVGAQRGATPEFGPRGAGGTLVFPLIVDGAPLGALVAGCPGPTAPSALAQVETQVELAAGRLQTAHLRHEVEGLRADRGTESTDAEGDELLKLSEALFTQDIELLCSNEKLGKIEKLKNDFIEKMSRELRTPLNSIIEAIIGVLAGENDAISDHAKASLRTALDEGTAFQRTLENILDLWRLKQNELPVELQEVNIAEIVEEAIFSVQDGIDERAVSIEREFAPGLPKVRTDLAKVNQLLFLLLDNAVKFTPSGTVRVRVEVDGNRLVAEISDTGIGICADDQEFIFDEFFQVDTHSSNTYRGAGLGLSLVRDLAVLLGGEIQLTSEPGKGTAIRFDIPVEVV
jgi:signal transduction histidine kinase